VAHQNKILQDWIKAAIPKLEKVRKISKFLDKTLELIKIRERFKKIKNKSTKQKIELSQVAKAVKSNIKQDLASWKENIITNILNDSNSLKNIKKQ